MLLTREKQWQFLKMVGRLIARAEQSDTPVVILEYYRSLETQKGYVARGASKTLDSKHIIGLAIDIAFLDDLRDDGKLNYSTEKYRPLGEFWESLGGRWGGRFGETSPGAGNGWDAGHLEYAG